jgi:hypothetical protein
VSRVGIGIVRLVLSEGFGRKDGGHQQCGYGE